MREQKSVLLRSAGFPADYMEMRYRCRDCKDTGYAEGVKCHCFRQSEMKYLYAQSNIEGIVAVENFDTFSFEYFDNNRVIPVLNRTVKQYMELVAEDLQEFCKGLFRGSWKSAVYRAYGGGKDISDQLHCKGADRQVLLGDLSFGK